ncbi:MAG: response regulator transcription factor [Alphaproteobacteria bacterium]
MTGSTSARILIIEDVKIMQEFLRLQMEAGGHEVTAVGGAEDALNAINRSTFDLIMMDLGLPDEDGLVLVRRIRTLRDTPIVVLTAREEDDARLAAFEAGVDDYIDKQVNARELLARIGNVLNRGKGRTGRADTSTLHRFGTWTLDLDAYSLVDETGRQLDLTPMELRVLGALAKANRRVLSRDQLLDSISDTDEPPTDRMIDAFVSRIRRKLGDASVIQTVRGVGYRLGYPRQD